MIGILIFFLLSHASQCVQYQFNADVGKIQSVLNLEDATNVNLQNQKDEDFCWIQPEQMKIQQIEFTNYQDLETMNRYYSIYADQQGIWVLMNDMILTKITHNGIILKTEQLNGNQNQFSPLSSDNGSEPLFFVNYQLVSDPQITVYRGILKTFDSFLFAIDKSIIIYDLSNGTLKYFGSIELTKFQKIIDYDIKKIDDKKYYLFIMDENLGLNIIKILLRYNNINSKLVYNELQPLIGVKSFICNTVNSCFAIYHDFDYKVVQFTINLFDNSCSTQVILNVFDQKLLKLIDAQKFLFIQSKHKHLIYLYNTQTFQELQIIGLQEISVINSSLIYAITQSKLLQLQIQTVNTQVLCYCGDENVCIQKYDYTLDYRQRMKDVNVTFTIEFKQNLENQIHLVLMIISSILIFFGIFIAVFWIYSLKTQVLLLEEKVKSGQEYLQKNKFPMLHTLENLAFTFRGVETMSKRIQQQESQEVQDSY